MTVTRAVGDHVVATEMTDHHHVITGEVREVVMIAALEEVEVVMTVSPEEMMTIRNQQADLGDPAELAMTTVHHQAAEVSRRRVLLK